MDIDFANPKDEQRSNNFVLLSKHYDKRKGSKPALQIRIVLDALAAAPSLADLPDVFRPHPLKGNLKGSFAVNVTEKNRIIFTPNHPNDSNFRIDIFKTITAITIEYLFTDYH